MLNVEVVVDLALTQVGGQYLYGGKAAASVPNPKASNLALDCSGLVTWAVDRAGGSIPDGSVQQREFCTAHGTIIPVAQAETTRGALCFIETSVDQHVVISLGNGETVEARGAAYGIGEWSIYRDVWTYAALIPGFTYGVPVPPAPKPTPRNLLLTSPMETGSDVLQMENVLRAHGYYKGALDGIFGPQCKAAVEAYQSAHHLTVDGIVGPLTRASLGIG